VREGANGTVDALRFVEPNDSQSGPLWKDHGVGLDLLEATRLRIGMSLETELIHRRSLSRAMEAIHASAQRIGNTDKLIERMWIGES
jgi:hypothetical protein